MDDQDPDWVICCSGGGIRSATYCLGALQRLRSGGLYRQARWIVGVSGGSYIAASLALVRHTLGPEAEDSAFEPRSAEEQHLRNNIRYIAPDAMTSVAGAISLIAGAAITAALVLAPVYALSHAWGWLLRATGVLTWTHSGASASVTGWSWWIAPAICAYATLVLSTFWWVSLSALGTGKGAQRARWTGRAVVVTAALALAMLATPPTISWLYDNTGPAGAIAQAFKWHWSLGTIGKLAGTFSGLVAALAAVAGWCRTQLAKVKAAETQATAKSPGLVTFVARGVVSHLTPWLGSAVVVVISMAVALTWTGAAARTGYSADQLVLVMDAVAIAVGVRVVADFNRLSLHDVYRWRLSTAYAVTRAACLASNPVVRAGELARAASIRLSELSMDEAPDLVICTTANRGVRPGQGGFCLAFDAKYATLRGRPGSAADCAQASTADYEHLVGHARLTLFDLVAISGAAVTPLMGSATKVAYRILLTATNVRLGLWLPHPAVVHNARAYLSGEYNKDRAGDWDPWWSRRPWLLMAWYVLPHPRWHADQKRSERYEARLWAHLLEVREHGQSAQATRRARLGAAACWRIMQPTMGLLWAEAAGRTSYRDTWINITDGGHYDNLGLVEALQRDPTHVLVLDASGDHVNTWSTLGRSMTLARMDVGVEVSLDPTIMATGSDRLAPGEVNQPWTVGSFGRASGASGSGHQDNLVVCKLGWWQDAPWDVVAFARSHPSFPCQPTRRHLTGTSEFEAYRELGASTVELAGRQGALPLDPSREQCPETEKIRTTLA